MRRNVIAAVVQLLGIAIMLAAAFTISVAAGAVVAGLAVLYVGLALEDDR